MDRSARKRGYFRPFNGLILLMRPGNALICGLSVITGSVIAGRPSDMIVRLFTDLSSQWTVRTWTAALSAALILAAGNVFNDVRDIAADSVNAPGRPLASGMISSSTAIVWAAFLAICGVALSILSGIYGIGIAIAAVFILILYDMRFKGIPLVGNISVAALGGLAFIYGGVAGGAVKRSLIPAGFAFLFHLAREIVKDAADVKGDRTAGISTIATKYGVVTAGRIAGWVLAALAIAVGIPWPAGVFGGMYFPVILVGVWPVIAYSIRVLFRQPGIGDMKHLAMVLKLDMPVGISAVLAGFQWFMSK